MVNRPKQIGTWGETGALRAILPYFPDATRIVQHGDKDQGDLHLNKAWMAEVKAGKQTVQVGPKLFDKWVSELWAEMAHSGRTLGFLVIQRHGYGQPNAHRWWAYIPLGLLNSVLNSDPSPMSSESYQTMVRMELCELLAILADAGETDAVPDAA
jgi:hypothetical protein